jgi:hypothetical protein
MREEGTGARGRGSGKVGGPSWGVKGKFGHGNGEGAGCRVQGSWKDDGVTSHLLVRRWARQKLVMLLATECGRLHARKLNQVLLARDSCRP